MNIDPTAIAADVARYFAILGAGVPIVWAVSEVVGKTLNVRESAVAMFFGPMYGIFFLLFSWLPLLPVELFPQAEIAVNFAWAALSGLASSGGAKILNDKLMKKQGWKIPAR
ncbi:MAG TPA: hypothetical protein VM285_01340 [Polyangia bacterium]|nr:hypothetical protein [Polyangia bacterium]